MNPLERRITAYHEAGHAVMTFRCGLPIDFVEICNAGPLYGMVVLPRGPLVSAALDDDAVDAPWPLVVRDTEHRVLVSLAGPLAEARLLGTKLRSHCSESDLEKCERVCDELARYRDRLVERGATIPAVEPPVLANTLRRRATRILARHDVWRAVAALAADVEAWRRLSGDDAADTVQWARRLRAQLALSLPYSARVREKPRRASRRANPFAAALEPIACATL